MSVTVAFVGAGFAWIAIDAPSEERTSVDGTFLGMLVLCLIPAAVYTFGIRARSLAIIFGLCLSVPTIAAWIAYYLSTSALSGVPVVFVVPLTLLTSVIGTVIDRSC